MNDGNSARSGRIDRRGHQLADARRGQLIGLGRDAGCEVCVRQRLGWSSGWLAGVGHAHIPTSHG
jgi:hypothetical protein